MTVCGIMEHQSLEISNTDVGTSEPKRSNVWTLRTMCLITGASRGFGQRMAIRFAERLPSNSAFILAARDKAGLATTEKAILALHPDTKVSKWPVDLSELNESMAADYLSGACQDMNVAPEHFDQIILVHNASSMGNISEWFTGHSNAEELNKYWRLNLTSVVVLNSVFWRNFAGQSVQRIVINISSICAIQAFKSWSLYCSGKAARDMMFSTMAIEEPGILVLSYAPGPLDTEMQSVARSETKDPEIREMFRALHSENRLLSCDQSLDKLMEILEVNRFNSGSHIDYYDDDY